MYIGVITTYFDEYTWWRIIAQKHLRNISLKLINTICIIHGATISQLINNLLQSLDLGSLTSIICFFMIQPFSVDKL